MKSLKNRLFCLGKRGLAGFSALLCSGLLLLPQAPSAVSAPDAQTASLAGTVVDRFAYDFPETRRDSVFAGRNVMAIVPHEDDELCILAGVLEEYVAAGSTVRVVFVTNGDYEPGSGPVRINEAISAMTLCGIPEENLVFLGYGDQWANKQRHLYNAADDAVMTSHGGFRATYGTKEHPAYREGTPYTRANMKGDIRSVIETYAPDTLFCIDFDGHKDHRAVSLLFEEALGELLRDDAGYTPTVLKGFAYSTSWHAETDFYGENIRSTLNPTDKPYMTEVNYYNWDDRIRLPVTGESLGRLKASTSTYAMLKAYASQRATGRSGGVLSGDRVFFLRDTESLLYRAGLTASSGDATLLNDFKIIDSADICQVECLFSGHVWSPDADDAEKRVQVDFGAPVTLSELRFYDNPALDSNVLDAEILFSDGSRLTTGALQSNGAATTLTFAPKAGITGLTVRLLATEGPLPGLCELEAYEKAPDHGMRLIKLINASDDFVYDYWIDPSGSERFGLYAFPEETGGALAERYTLTVEGDDSCSAVFDGDGILVRCPAGRSFTLTVASIAEPEVSDAVRISNPSSARRALLELMQHYEHAAGL